LADFEIAVEGDLDGDRQADFVIYLSTPARTYEEPEASDFVL
jgi:hypothetical protein